VTTTTTATSTSGPSAKFYIVQSGDTMGSISVKTHVPLATIEALNPGVSSNAMSVGQRLRIRK
jgi:LysM repeat protein